MWSRLLGPDNEIENHINNKTKIVSQCIQDVRGEERDNREERVENIEDDVM